MLVCEGSSFQFYVTIPDSETIKMPLSVSNKQPDCVSGVGIKSPSCCEIKPYQVTKELTHCIEVLIGLGLILKSSMNSLKEMLYCGWPHCATIN